MRAKKLLNLYSGNPDKVGYRVVDYDGNKNELIGDKRLWQIKNSKIKIESFYITIEGGCAVFNIISK